MARHLSFFQFLSFFLSIFTPLLLLALSFFCLRFLYSIPLSFFLSSICFGLRICLYSCIQSSPTFLFLSYVMFFSCLFSSVFYFFYSCNSFFIIMSMLSRSLFSFFLSISLSLFLIFSISFVSCCFF